MKKRKPSFFSRLRTILSFAAIPAICAVWFMGAMLQNPAAFEVSGQNGVSVPIIMYHSLLHDPKQAGTYVLSPDDFRRDIEYLFEQGYTPVLLSDILKYVKGEAVLPDKPVALTFDDGYLNNLTYLPSILSETGACATISVVGEFTEEYTKNPDPNPSYAYMTWADIAAISEHPNIEIANHSFLFHDSYRSYVWHSDQTQYTRELVPDVVSMAVALNEKCDIVSSIFVYPFGYIPPGADDMLVYQGFEMTLGCSERINTVQQGDMQSLLSMGRFNRPSGISTEDFMEKILMISPSK